MPYYENDPIYGLNLEVPEVAYMLGFLQGHLKEYVRVGGVTYIDMFFSRPEAIRELSTLFPAFSTFLIRPVPPDPYTGNFQGVWAITDEIREQTLKLTGFSPDTLPKQPLAFNDYIRGLLDGQGTMGFTEKRKPFFQVITSSKLRNYLHGYFYGINGVYKCVKITTRSIQVHGVYAKQAARVLYYPGCLAPQYRFRMATRIGKWQKRKKVTFWSTKDLEIIANTHSMEETAELLGRPVKAIYKKRLRMGIPTDKEVNK